MSLDEQIFAAIEVLKQGGIILYPTDTVWGIGCDATNKDAVQKIYDLKQSESKTSMLILVENEDRLMMQFKKVPDVAWELIEVSDKPLTLILDGGCGVADNLIPDEGTLGVRIPKHEFCNKLLRKFRKPIVSTSANISGKAAHLNAKEISKEITDGVDLIISPEFEGRPTRKASSIIKLGLDSTISIIRE